MTTALSEEVRRGLTAHPKTLPPILFYDEEGSRLYERITELPEYYLTRAERSIFLQHADELATSGGRDFIGPRAPVVFGHDGSCFDPTRFFHSMKARIQRALLDPQGVRKAVNV